MKYQKIEKILVVQRVTGEPNFLKRVKRIDRDSVYSFFKIVDNYCRMSRIIADGKVVVK